MNKFLSRAAGTINTMFALALVLTGSLGAFPGQPQGSLIANILTGIFAALFVCAPLAVQIELRNLTRGMVERDCEGVS